MRLDRIQAYIDSGKLDHKGVIDAAALVKAGVIRRELDGVRLVIGSAGFHCQEGDLQGRPRLEGRPRGY